MSWTNFSNPAKHTILIREPFIEKYTLTIVTDIMAGNLPIKSKTEIRWQLKVNRVEADYTDIELITLDNQLLESNNPMVKDMAGMSQAFSRMYNELQVRVDSTGKVLQILNIDLIRKKWDQTKAEITDLQETNPAIKNIISLNDELFITPDKMALAVQNNEFFMIYYHHFYGLSLPGTTKSYVQRTVLNTADLSWRYNVSNVSDTYDTGDLYVEVDGIVNTSTGGGWAKEAYKAFSHLDLASLKPDFEERGVYRFDKSSGMLVSADLLKKEMVHPQLLHATISYHITSDTAPLRTQETQTKQTQSPLTPPVAPPGRRAGGFSILADE
ncbi:MAG: hypothetical protein JWR38_4622 [Mucilaginibacter sp.]|nr:hypothetical protein [Mucilaginibacter sp.]